MKKKLLSLILAVILPSSMMFLTSCGDKDLKTPDKDTISAWTMSVEQEDTFEKLTILLGAEGEFYQFNAKQCNLVLNAHYYKDGELVQEGEFAQFIVDGDGYMYIDYSDIASDDPTEAYLDEGGNIAQIGISMMTEDGEDGTILEVPVAGFGSSDTMISLLNTDDTWESGENIAIPYEEEFDLWGINLSGTDNAGELGETVSATKETWMKGECIIITAKFTEDEVELEGIEGDIESVFGDESDLDNGGAPEDMGTTDIDEINKQLEWAEEDN